MFHSRLGRIALAILTVTLLLGASGFAQAKKVTDFARLDEELKLMHERELFKGGKTKESKDSGKIKGKGEPVKFDAESARKEKFSEETIKLATELAAFTNDLMMNVSEEQPGIPDGPADLSKYPALAAYFDAATKKAKQPSAQASGTMKPNAQAIQWVVCGWYGNPKPASAAPWVNFSSSNPEATLKSWGYHNTWNLAGGGYTRPQSWSWWYCGLGTYRDHALITGPTTFREQNYDGWSPRGEPNPEVYASGPWPYGDWPAYVYWWHQTY